MAKIKVAIYDAGKQYRERFADYLMSYKAKETELTVFFGGGGNLFDMFEKVRKY